MGSMLIPALQLFRLWLGVTEYLFRKPALLDEIINISIEDNTFRSDDLEFTFAARVSPWSSALGGVVDVCIYFSGLVGLCFIRRFLILSRSI